jgi:hypothetical protein
MNQSSSPSDSPGSDSGETGEGGPGPGPPVIGIIPTGMPGGGADVPLKLKKPEPEMRKRPELTPTPKRSYNPHLEALCRLRYSSQFSASVAVALVGGGVCAVTRNAGACGLALASSVYAASIPTYCRAVGRGATNLPEPSEETPFGNE